MVKWNNPPIDEAVARERAKQAAKAKAASD